MGDLAIAADAALSSADCELRPMISLSRRMTASGP